MKRLLAAGLLSASVVLPAGPVAAAQHEMVLSDARLDAGRHALDATLTVRGLPTGAGIDASSVTATVAGRTLPVSVEVKAATAARAPRVLVVADTSGSMSGKPLEHAKQAISEFVAEAPSQVELGLMAFSSAPRLLVAPTTSRSQVLSGVTDLKAQGETALYDAVLAGLQALGPDGDRRLVVLSDGADTRSRATIAPVLAAARGSGVTVDAVGFNTDEAVTGVLEQIAASGRGEVHTARNADQLTAALAATSREYATALAVRVLLPPDLRGTQDVSLIATSPKGRLSATTSLALGVEPAQKARGWWGSRGALVGGLVALAVSLLLGSLVLLDNDKRSRRRMQQTLGKFTTADAPAKADLRTASPVTRTALKLADKLVAARNLQDRLTLRLERAAIPLAPAEWILLQAGVTVGVTLVLVLLGTALLLALVVACVLGVVVPRIVLRVRGSRRQRAFEENLPDTLQLTASSLGSGYSLAQALDGVVREGSEPMATEIGRALAESRLGVPVESTLQTMAERMQSRDFGWVVMAIRVQREVGGNLAGILTTVSETMRERAGMRRHVRALSAEGRLSAYILLGLPVVIAAYMALGKPEYIEPLYTTVIGWLLILVALVLMSVGAFLMNRMVKVEI